jgi:N-acetyl-anhydromuramyl-L-alanine amidase AmpD
MAENVATPQGAGGIWICGEFFALAGNVKVVTFKDDPYWDFTKVQAPPGVERDKYVFERFFDKARPGKGNRVQTLDDARERVDLVLMHTDGMTTARLTHQVLVNKGFSTHFCVDWDGTVYQCADPGFHGTLHGGEQNNRSIGIDMNNDLPDLLGTEKGKAYPYPPDQTDKKYRRPLSEVVTINGSKKQSFGYTDAQYVGIIELLKVLCDVLDIPKEPPFDETGSVIPGMLQDPFGFKGLAAHWNTAPSRWDPGPGFDWQRVYHALRGEHNSFPVVIEEGQNIAALLAPDKVQIAAEKVYQNNELGGGGYYPIGLNQNWHGGIHLHSSVGTNVHAMFDGVLVAARFGHKKSEYGTNTPLGSNNFVVLRHDVPMPKTQPLRVFSLYMHLGPLDIDPTSPAAEWLRQTFRVYKGEEDAERDALDMGEPKEGEEEIEPDRAVDDSYKPDVEEEYVKPSDVKPYLDVGYKLTALRKGMVALFDVEPADRQIRVKAGEVIGTVGEFSDGGESRPMIHVEVFADETWKKAIDMGVHARYWVEIEEDVGSDLRVETPDVLNLFSTSASRRKGRSFFQRVQREVLPLEIEQFFGLLGENEGAKQWLRKAITRHVSEWSDQVDWVKALSAAQTWAEKVHDFNALFQDRSGAQRMGIFSTEIRKFLPFIWLNAEVAEHIGLQVKGAWTGVVYHFHPITFLYWLTYHSSSRVKALSVGKSAKELKKEREKMAQKEMQARLEGQVLENVEAYHGDEEEWVMELEESSPAEVLRDWWGRPGSNEWQRPEKAGGE